MKAGTVTQPLYNQPVLQQLMSTPAGAMIHGGSTEEGVELMSNCRSNGGGSTGKGVELQILTQSKHRYREVTPGRHEGGGVDTSNMLDFKSSVTKQSCKPKKVVKSPLGKFTRNKVGASMTHVAVSLTW